MGMCANKIHHAAKHYLGLIAPAGHGARRACVNWTPPPWVGSGRPGGRGEPLASIKKTSPRRWSSHCKAWSAFETPLAPPDFQ
jgi:hypothetical protein